MNKQLLISFSEEAKTINSEKLTKMIAAFSGNISMQSYKTKVKYFCFYSEYISRGLDIKLFKHLSSMLSCFKSIECHEITDEEAEKIIELERIEKSKSKVDIEFVIAKKYIALSERAAIKKMEFSLTLSDIRSLLKRKTCQYTGVKISYINDDEHEKLTFDRLDNSIGYVKGNVFAVSDTVNQIKNMLLEHPDSPLSGNKLTLENVESSIKMMVTIKDLMTR